MATHLYYFMGNLIPLPDTSVCEKALPCDVQTYPSLKLLHLGLSPTNYKMVRQTSIFLVFMGIKPMNLAQLSNPETEEGKKRK